MEVVLIIGNILLAVACIVSAIWMTWLTFGGKRGD